MKKQTIIIALLFLTVLTAFGQETKQEKKKSAYDTWMYIPLKDHLTHENMKGVKAELLSAADSSLVDSSRV